MSKNRRQDNARKIIMLTSKRMLANLFQVTPKTFNKEITCFNDDELCSAIRVLYERKKQTPDRLTKAYDLASLVI